MLKKFWPLENKSTRINIINGKCEDEDIVKELNLFFANVGENLAKKFQDDGEEFMPKHPPIFEFCETSYETVKDLLKGLNVNKSAGSDGIWGGFLRDAGDYIVMPLVHLFILSIRSKSFPSLWKNGLVTVIYI